jgi:acetyl-CoA carboxylase biotin carboxyl carrier protein
VNGQDPSASSAQLVALLDAFERSDWQEMTLEIGGDRIAVSRREQGLAVDAAPNRPAAARPSEPRPAEPAPVERPAAAPVAVRSAPQARPAAVEVAPPKGAAVRSPSVGIFWRAPAPTEPPFVEVGSRVEADDTIGIVEVMKLMQQVPAGIAGVVTAVVVSNAETVEHNQPLVFIDAAG